MISVKNVFHTYNKNKEEVLHNISIDIPDGKFVLLLGASGSGKTTLLNIIAGLLKPAKGNVIFDNVDIYSKKPDELCAFRSEKIGFVFQNYFLEKCYTAFENTLIPTLLNKKIKEEEREKRVYEALNKVGLKNRVDSKPTELSGGECQRVSIARAIVNEAQLIIADEPTGNLDSINGERIINLLMAEKNRGKTILMVTHNESYIKYADIVFSINDGVVNESSKTL